MNSATNSAAEAAVGLGLIILFIVIGIGALILFIFGIIHAVKTKHTEISAGMIIVYLFFFGGLIAVIIYIVQVGKNKDRIVDEKRHKEQLEALKAKTKNSE